MTKLQDTLVAEYAHCPANCSLCGTACASRYQGTACIFDLHLPEVAFHGVVKCNQCGQPKCLSVCPTAAITKSETDGVVRINDDKCVGCGLCNLACPYGGVSYNASRAKAYKCDNCNGEPECVPACVSGQLTFARAQEAIGQLNKQIMVKGTLNCAGCGIDLSARVITRFFDHDTYYAGAPGCSISTIMCNAEGATCAAPSIRCCMTNAPGIMTGVQRYFRHIGKEASCIVFAGDGMTADVGFQSLSGAAERGENIIYICFDNEAYMNTGIQQSGTTPHLAWTRTSPVGIVTQGKQRQPKNMPLLMAFHGISYVATASVSYLDDFISKLARARDVKDGMAYLHLFAPCPTGWRASIDSAIDLGRTAVETNYFPLWEANYGRFRLTYQPKSRRPITEYTRLSGRFRHLNEEQLAKIQETVDSRLKLLMALIASTT